MNDAIGRQQTKHRQLMAALVAFADAGRALPTTPAVGQVRAATGYGRTTSVRLLADLTAEGYLVSTHAGGRGLLSLTPVGARMVEIQRAIRGVTARERVAA